MSFDPTSASQLLGLPHFTLPAFTAIHGLYVTNTTYAALSMLEGDSFAKKFGGPTGNDPDYFLLTAYGIDASGHVLANHVDFYLADYRFADNALDYVVDTWQYMDLSALAGAVTIAFNLSSSDVGDFGMNTPGYFAIDDLVLSTAAVPEPASVALVGVGLFGLVGFGRTRRRLRGWAGLAAGLIVVGIVGEARAQSGPYDPQVGSGAQDAIPKTSSAFQEWASSVVSFNPGPQNISNPNSPPVTFGNPANALGPGSGDNTFSVVSLGDGGSITLGFTTPIVNGPGADLAVFENGSLSGSSGLAFLELATVSVSSDGIHFFEFPAVSLTQTQTQVGGFGLLDASNLYDLAGKYIAGYGTPFDLSELANVSPFLDINDVTEVKITDVVGSIDPRYGTLDSRGNLINDPFPTPFASGGFDLNGVGVLPTWTPPRSPSRRASSCSGSRGGRIPRNFPPAGRPDEALTGHR